MSLGERCWGNHFTILGDHIASDSIALISLDPPVTSSRNDNGLVKGQNRHQSDAQIEAFIGS